MVSWSKRMASIAKKTGKKKKTRDSTSGLRVYGFADFFATKPVVEGRSFEEVQKKAEELGIDHPVFATEIPKGLSAFF